MKQKILEVIANKPTDAKIINQSQADQVEYCVDLDNGGLTPLIEDVQKILKMSHKKVRIILRNHFDNFHITRDQLGEIIDFMKKTNHLNIDGYVFGAITKDNEIDYQVLEQVIACLNGKLLTFHKAFDFVDNKNLHLEKLLKYPEVKFVLTSGGVGNPLDNLDFFINIKDQYKHKILVGGGVNLDVITRLKEEGFSNFHIGKAARGTNDYQSKLNLEKINKYKAVIDE